MRCMIPVAQVLTAEPRPLVLSIQVAEDSVFDDAESSPEYPYVMVTYGGELNLQEVLDDFGTKTLPENQVRWVGPCSTAQSSKGLQ